MVNVYANTFHFVDPDGNDPVPCEMRIEVNEIVSNRPAELEQLPTTYQIVMDSSYIKEDEDGNAIKERINSLRDLRKHSSHPYSNLRVMYLYVLSVVKNDMTTQMVKFMMMNDKELAEHTGTITPKRYRRNILRALTTFTE